MYWGGPHTCGHCFCVVIIVIATSYPGDSTLQHSSLSFGFWRPSVLSSVTLLEGRHSCLFWGQTLSSYLFSALWPLMSLHFECHRLPKEVSLTKPTLVYGFKQMQLGSCWLLQNTYATTTPVGISPGSSILYHTALRAGIDSDNFCTPIAYMEPANIMNVSQQEGSFQPSSTLASVSRVCTIIRSRHLLPRSAKHQEQWK